MNVEAILSVRGRVAAEERIYDQAFWGRDIEGHGCVTPCCIGGHAAVDAGYVLVEPDGDGLSRYCRRADGSEGVRDVASVAQEHLGLTDEEATDMFGAFPKWVDGNGTHIRSTHAATREEGLAMLDHAATHHEIVWRLAEPPVKATHPRMRGGGE